MITEPSHEILSIYLHCNLCFNVTSLCFVSGEVLIINLSLYSQCSTTDRQPSVMSVSMRLFSDRPVLLHCWLDHVICKNASTMTYNVFSGTLNLTQLTQLKFATVTLCCIISIASPFSSDRQHLSYGDCLEVRGEIIRTVLCCIVY